MIRQETFAKVMLPCLGPCPMSRLAVLLVHLGRLARVAPVNEDLDFYEGDVALHLTGSDQTVNVVVSTVGPGGSGNETRSFGRRSRRHNSYVI